MTLAILVDDASTNASAAGFLAPKVRKLSLRNAGLVCGLANGECVMSPGRFEIKSKASSVLAIISLVAGASAGMAVLSDGKSLLDTLMLRQAGHQVEQTDLAKTKARLDILDRRIAAIEAQATQLPTLPAQSKVTSQISRLESAQQDLSERQKKIEDAVIASPEKALTLPLMRRDLDAIKQDQEARALEIRRAIDQVYDMNKWLLGSVAIAIISLALSSLLRRPEK